MTLTPELQAIGITLPPTQDELPYSDGEPMESERHFAQMRLLVESLQSWLDAREDGYIGGNMFVYYSLAQVKNQDFRGPDFFAALGVPKKERKSWVCWEEGKTPDVVIELLSESTARVDKGEKKQIYQNRLHVPEYFWYDPFDPEDWAGFQLQAGSYQSIAPNAQGQLISQILQLALIRWQGTYQRIETTWLRWSQLDGTLLLTPEEQERQCAEQERLRAEQERLRAEQERLRAEQAQTQVQQIIQNLLQSGMNAAQVSEITGLSPEQVTALASPPST
jgi:Uma2 family endonuclease